MPFCNSDSTLPENGLFSSAVKLGRGKVEDDGINAGVEGAEQQGVVPPCWALTLEETHYMRDVVRHHTDEKHSQSS